MMPMRHSIETTDEELLPRVNRRSRMTPILVVCVANLAGAVGVIHNSEPETDCAINDTSSSLSARAMYDTHTGDLLDFDLQIPEMHRDAYTSFIPSALDDPLVQLASRTGDVTNIVAGVSQPMKGNPLFSNFSSESGYYNRGAQCNPEKKLILAFDPKKKSDPETGLFADEHRTRMLIVHEAIHGLNDAWWQKIKESRAFESVQDPALYNLQNACDEINRWVSYRNTGNMPESFPYPEDATVADVCSTLAMTLDTAALREAFKCANEGDMLKDRRGLKTTPNFGHPWDNATELASSVTNLLKFDPGYIFRCLSDKENLDAPIIKKYIKATLELSFAYQPELESLLRKDPHTSEIIDLLLSAS